MKQDKKTFDKLFRFTMKHSFKENYNHSSQRNFVKLKYVIEKNRIYKILQKNTKKPP